VSAARSQAAASLTATDAQLTHLHKQGARGICFISTQPGRLAFDQLEPFADRLREPIQLMLAPQHLVELEPRLAKP